VPVEKENQLRNLCLPKVDPAGGVQEIKDPDPVFRIWIRIQEGKNDPQKLKKKKVKKCHVLKCWMFSVEG
jgi:hypothetical protein